MTQQSTGAGATALGLNVSAGKTPFTVNSGTKAADLNADALDGLDSGCFVYEPVGRAMYARTTVAFGTSATLLEIPGFVRLSAVSAEYGSSCPGQAQALGQGY